MTDVILALSVLLLFGLGALYARACERLWSVFELLALFAGLLLIGYLIFTVLRPEKF